MTGIQEFEQALRDNVSLAPMTTLGIGGPARYFADVTTTGGLLAGVDWARSRAVPLFVLGGGSNIVIRDDGFPGLVLRICIRGIETRFENDVVVVTAGAGEEWDPLVARFAAKGWAGLECLSGIPGRVGATPIQNVGAYGQETSETLRSVEAIDQTSGLMLELNAAECEFGYRSSRFKSRDRDRFIITRVIYHLKPGGLAAVRYPELQRYLAELACATPTLLDVRNAVLALRRRKAMVIDPDDIDSRSVGSFFVNPVVRVEEYERIKNRAIKASLDGHAIPAFAAADGMIKLAAGWLIEHAGIKRGFIYGNVGTSNKHALAIINRGGGTAREVWELKEMIQQRVLDQFGIALTPEPVFVGF